MTQPAQKLLGCLFVAAMLLDFVLGIACYCSRDEARRLRADYSAETERAMQSEIECHGRAQRIERLDVERDQLEKRVTDLSQWGDKLEKYSFELQKINLDFEALLHRYKVDGEKLAADLAEEKHSRDVLVEAYADKQLQVDGLNVVIEALRHDLALCRDDVKCAEEKPVPPPAALDCPRGCCESSCGRYWLRRKHRKQNH